jgi:hypothetical protein
MKIFSFLKSEFNWWLNEQPAAGKQYANAALQRSQSERSNGQIEILLHCNKTIILN